MISGIQCLNDSIALDENHFTCLSGHSKASKYEPKSPGAIRRILTLPLKRNNWPKLTSYARSSPVLFSPSDSVRSDCSMVETISLWALLSEGTLVRRSLYPSPAQH